MQQVYSQITDEIKISVVPEHVEESSDPVSSIFAFSYTITIENLSSNSVQLLERHWVIVSAGKQVAEVVGPGVVGVQPTLNSGQAFQYTSGAVINDPIGAMEGSYTFRDSGGKYFQVRIPRFELMYPVIFH